MAAKYAHLLFANSEGVKLRKVRKVRLAPSDGRFRRVGELQRQLRAKEGEPFFHGWQLRRSYSTGEMSAAEALYVEVPPYYEPGGEELYDESTACAICGVGRVLKSNLILDTERLPITMDIVSTIAGELIVSSRFVRLVEKMGLTGATFHPVCDRETPGVEVESWSHLVVQPPYLRVDVSTRTGIDPFDPDREGRYRCPLGHVAGLNLLSELSVERASWGGRDFYLTQQCFGVRRGLLRPTPLLVVAPRVWRIFCEEEIRGASFEIAHVW